jgi:hypothetical protein
VAADPVSGTGGIVSDIRQGHALDLIAAFDGEADLIATDPPYAMGGEGAEHGISATVATALRESAYRLRKGGWAVVFAASSWRSTVYMVEAVRGILEPVRTGTWIKPVAKTKVRTPGWAWASVNAVVFRRPGAPGLGEPSPLLDYVIAAPVMNGRRAQMPVEVARWAVAPFAVPGGVMLDPFAGSTVLCAAAEEAGMRAVGFDFSPGKPPALTHGDPAPGTLFDLFGEATA